MARALAKVETSTVVLEAAKKMLRQKGYAKLSTRDVAAAAGVPLSQIHYHFGSKQGMVLALFEHLNSQLLDRQDAMFHDSSLTLSEQWDRACDYLDEDIASGYVRVLQELIAASWADSSGGEGDPGRSDGMVQASGRIWPGAPNASSAASVRSRPTRSPAWLERLHRRGEPVPSRRGEEGRARSGNRFAASAISFE